jgi:hypothetical protein
MTHFIPGLAFARIRHVTNSSRTLTIGTSVANSNTRFDVLESFQGDPNAKT